MSTPRESPVTVTKGICYAIFAYDIGTSIALDEADRHTEGDERDVGVDDEVPCPGLGAPGDGGGGDPAGRAGRDPARHG